MNYFSYIFILYYKNYILYMFNYMKINFTPFLVFLLVWSCGWATSTAQAQNWSFAVGPGLTQYVGAFEYEGG